MTRKKGLRAFSKDELLQELARRHAEERYREGMTMTDMELAVEQLKGESAGTWRRRAIARAGARWEAADQAQLHKELKPSEARAEVLVVETDGSLLPIRGPEP